MNVNNTGDYMYASSSISLEGRAVGHDQKGFLRGLYLPVKFLRGLLAVKVYKKVAICTGFLEDYYHYGILTDCHQ